MSQVDVSILVCLRLMRPKINLELVTLEGRSMIGRDPMGKNMEKY